MTASRTPDVNSTTSTHIKADRMQLYTMLPGRVTKYDAKLQRANVQPLILNTFLDGDGVEQEEEYPEIPNVPIKFLRTLTQFVTMEINPGDIVTLQVCQRSIDLYQTKSKGKRPIDPVFLHMHYLNDAVAFPGWYPDLLSLPESEADIDGMALGTSGGVQIHIKKEAGQIHLGSKDAADALALASKVEAQLQQIETAFNTHIHTTTATVGATPAPGVIAIPVAQISTGSVGSDVVKAD